MDRRLDVSVPSTPSQIRLIPVPAYDETVSTGQPLLVSSRSPVMMSSITAVEVSGVLTPPPPMAFGVDRLAPPPPTMFGGQPTVPPLHFSGLEPPPAMVGGQYTAPPLSFSGLEPPPSIGGPPHVSSKGPGALPAPSAPPAFSPPASARIFSSSPPFGLIEPASSAPSVNLIDIPCFSRLARAVMFAWALDLDGPTDFEFAMRVKVVDVIARLASVKEIGRTSKLLHAKWVLLNSFASRYNSFVFRHLYLAFSSEIPP